LDAVTILIPITLDASTLILIPDFPQEGSAFAATNENALTPFGGGARLCVGYKFAQQEALITLVRLYQR
jgi:hypothetical protein